MMAQTNHSQTPPPVYQEVQRDEILDALAEDSQSILGNTDDILDKLDTIQATVAPLEETARETSSMTTTLLNQLRQLEAKLDQLLTQRARHRSPSQSHRHGLDQAPQRVRQPKPRRGRVERHGTIHRLMRATLT